jgi:hypothetical protein
MKGAVSVKIKTPQAIWSTVQTNNRNRDFYTDFPFVNPDSFEMNRSATKAISAKLSAYEVIYLLLTYLLTYLLHHCIHKSPPPVPILSQIDPVHTPIQPLAGPF